MEELITPLGKIKILIDGTPIIYSVTEVKKIEGLCPHVLGRFRIEITYVPDGKEHNMACVFEPVCDYNASHESGERLECQGFYNDHRYKMSIGVECDTLSDEYDYDVNYLDNGMSYHIKSNTVTKNYIFGISWIDNVGWDDPIDDENNRDVETWFGADPTMAI